MVRPALSDPTAGERARRIREHPGAAEPIMDPMDRRYGESQLDDPARRAKAGVISDPTDPQYGAPAD
jgi:hypothetical protein